ncbi:DUF2780 domain-containing protein [Pseudomonas citronellolis]|uniref:DUF2780 domain-containing protein n=1 Tax=Pseudomonas citronellolis TaxID=53408 RepID=UPI0023E3ED89|nr:DUF2780 domain-containing protein [Pseudomonas citronellolis]MDF3937153.1 DUF2780 domain-containing protein [Pseudomonas citronellolis]
MFTRSLLALAACAWLVALPAAAETFEEIPSAESGAAATTANGLVETLGQRLNISDEQAIGGAGALLGLAMNRLDDGQGAQLQHSLPGLDQLSSGNLGGGIGALLGGAGQILGGIQSLQDVDQVFNVLGMNEGMVDQFAGVMLDYLVKQGLNSQLLGSLGKLWNGTPTPLAPSAAVAGKPV